MERKCSKCKVKKDISEFYKNRSQLGGHEYFCKICSNTRHRTDSYKKQALAAINRHKKRHQIKVYNLKKALGACCNPECNELEAICLDFHHVCFPKIGRIDRVLSWKRFIDEAAKCVVLCKNCHAKERAGMLKIHLLPIGKERIKSLLPKY